MRYVNNFDEVSRRIEEALRQSLDLIGQKAITLVIDNISRIKQSQGRLVDTGLMRNSNAYELRDDGIEVGNTVKYAVYQELGTERIKATPFFKDAVVGGQNAYRRIIEAVFRRLL